MKHFMAHGGLAAAVLAAGMLYVATPAQAGFLDDLFGSSSAPSAPTFGYEAQPQTGPSYDPYSQPEPRKRKVVKAVVDDKPVRQKTTDLMLDKTLRPGDAVMMKDGIHVYAGSESTKHSSKQFVPLLHARRMLGSEARAKLVTVDPIRNAPLRMASAQMDNIESGRSATTETQINKGFKITDARGASIRYVGP